MEESQFRSEPPVIEDPPNVLFFTDNGHGLGHLTRLLAVANQAQGRFKPIFLTMSLGFPLLQAAGYPTEYIPSYMQLGLAKTKWERMYTSSIIDLISAVRARVVVVDHVSPPRSFATMREGSIGLDFIWSRRGLWKEGRNQLGISIGKSFDVVVEPGDLAGPTDVGLTADDRDGVIAIEPVVITRRDEMLNRSEAREALGMPTEVRAVLVQLSDSSPEKLQRMIEEARRVATRNAGGSRLLFFAPQHVLHGANLKPVDGVVMKPAFPLARYLHAFDGVISTAGYNSYHEIVLSGVPAVFVARDTDSLDDQQRRARFSELCGRAFWAPSVFDSRFTRAVRRMLQHGEAEIAEATSAELGDMRGAHEFADIIAARSRRQASSDFYVSPAVTHHETLDSSMGPSTEPQGGDQETVVIRADGLSTSELEGLALKVVAWREANPSITPIFLLRDGDLGAMASRGLLFETVMSESDWITLAASTPYEQYMETRLRRIIERYGATHVLEPGPRVESIVGWSS